MSQVESNIVKPVFACRDVIGVKGLCDKTYPYNLDLLGISLNKAAKLADTSMITGKELISQSVEFAWEQVMKDLRIDGFRLNGVQKVYRNNFTESLSDLLTETKSFNRKCDVEKFFFNHVSFKVAGELSVVLSIVKDGVVQEIFNDTATDETVKVNIDSDIVCDSLSFIITATGTGQFYKTDDNGILNYDGSLACDDKLFYCKHWNYLITAVQYKTAAQILNSAIFSDRYNDLIIYKQGEIATRLAQLDSSYNLLNNENRLQTKALYQQEIEIINAKLKVVVKESKCTCCFECDQFISSHISMP